MFAVASKVFHHSMKILKSSILIMFNSCNFSIDITLSATVIFYHKYIRCFIRIVYQTFLKLKMTFKNQDIFKAKSRYN